LDLLPPRQLIHGRRVEVDNVVFALLRLRLCEVNRFLTGFDGTPGFGVADVSDLVGDGDTAAFEIHVVPAQAE
jgi:hypothetical protein